MTSLSLLLLMCQTQPADPTLDWLLDAAAVSAATQPADVPTSQPVSPFVQKEAAGVTATVTLSDGTTLTGPCWTTPGKPLRIWDEASGKYIDLHLEMIRTLEAKVLWERDEPEWRFKTSGFDEKIYTGRTYPARETQYRITLADGSTVTGGVVAPLYVRVDERTRSLVLHKRAKGDAGTSLASLVYIKNVAVAPPASAK